MFFKVAEWLFFAGFEANHNKEYVIEKVCLAYCRVYLYITGKDYNVFWEGK